MYTDENNVVTNTEEITVDTKEENSTVQHPAIYPNSKDPKLTEKIVGEFNKYYTRLKRLYMVSRNEHEKIINDLKIAEITRLKMILKYFLHKENIDHEDLRMITQKIQEIHTIDYENKKKSEIKRPKKKKPVNNTQQRSYNQQNKTENNNGYQYSRVRQNSNPRTYNDNKPYSSYKASSTDNASTDSPTRPQKKEKTNSKYQRQMNFQHNGKKK